MKSFLGLVFLWSVILSAGQAGPISLVSVTHLLSTRVEVLESDDPEYLSTPELKIDLQTRSSVIPTFSGDSIVRTDDEESGSSHASQSYAIGENGLVHESYVSVFLQTNFTRGHALSYFEAIFSVSEAARFKLAGLEYYYGFNPASWGIEFKDLTRSATIYESSGPTFLGTYPGWEGDVAPFSITGILSPGIYSLSFLNTLTFDQAGGTWDGSIEHQASLLVSRVSDHGSVMGIAALGLVAMALVASRKRSLA